MSVVTESIRSPISTEAAGLLFHDAHTAYAFTSEPVTDAEMNTVYELMIKAPSAMNSQPMRITVLRSDAAKARLMPHLGEANRPKAASAPVVAILSADTDFHELLPRLLPQAPDAKAMFSDDAKREAAAMFNATLQAAYFIIAARAAGLDTGPMGGFDRDGVNADFFAGTTMKAILVVNLGHAAAGGTFPRNPRLGYDEVVTTL
jgi:3-hydroxypropanoate dehydrogenase